MSNRNAPVIIDQQTDASAPTRNALSQQVADQEWSNLARQLPSDERIVIQQDTRNTYTIERQRLADPALVAEQSSKQALTWSYVGLVLAVLGTCIFAYSMYLQHVEVIS